MNESAVTDLEPALSLSSKRRRLTGILFGLAIVGVLGVAGYIVFGLVTEQPGAAACDRLDELGAERVVQRLERRVSSSVVRMKTIDGTERVEVSGCRQAMSTLSQVTSHKQFSKLVDCIANASNEATAARCL
jgi:hypothetical protein